LTSILDKHFRSIESVIGVFIDPT